MADASVKIQEDTFYWEKIPPVLHITIMDLFVKLKSKSNRFCVRQFHFLCNKIFYCHEVLYCIILYAQMSFFWVTIILLKFSLDSFYSSTSMLQSNRFEKMKKVCLQICDKFVDLYNQ